jgi:hypothetical protein
MGQLLTPGCLQCLDEFRIPVSLSYEGENCRREEMDNGQGTWRTGIRNSVPLHGKTDPTLSPPPHLSPQQITCVPYGSNVSDPEYSLILDPVRQVFAESGSVTRSRFCMTIIRKPCSWQRVILKKLTNILYWTPQTRRSGFKKNLKPPETFANMNSYFFPFLGGGPLRLPGSWSMI